MFHVNKNVKQSLKEGKVTVGSWITIGNVFIAELLATSGFDWLTIDMEHSSITLREAQQLIQVIELSGVTPLVRVENNDPNLIKRVMDAGAHGVIVPMVNSKEDAVKAVSAVRYPPVGKRGVGLARAQGYGFEFERYKGWVNENSIIVVQIEHIAAVENLEEILKVPGVDGSIIGPYDLSASLGYPGEFEHSKVKAALQRYEVVCEKMNVPMGVHVIPPDYQKVLNSVNKGYKFIAFSLDTLFLGTKCKAELDKITAELKS